MPFDSSGWNYFFPVTIDNSVNSASALSYYQIPISITGSAYASWAAHGNSDGSDLRVVDQDGTLLSHWLERIDVVNLRVLMHAKVPTIAVAGSRSLRIYYGKSSATTVSSQATTIGPTNAITGPSDIWTQSDASTWNDGETSILLRNQTGANSSLNGRILVFMQTGGTNNGAGTPDISLAISTDGGITFPIKSTVLTHLGSNACAVRSAIELANGTILLCYGYDSTTNWASGKGRQYIAKSTDGGTTWTNLSTSPANQLAVPWTVGTDVGAVYGRFIEVSSGGDILLPCYSYTVNGTTPSRSTLIRCPSGSDPINGANWSLWGTIANSNTDKMSETSVIQTLDTSHLLAVMRNDTSGGTGNLYSTTSNDGGATWSALSSLNLPGTGDPATANNAVSPFLLKLSSGNYLLAWGVRYGTFYGTAVALSTDGGATWLDRNLVLLQSTPISGQSAVAYGYPYVEQRSDGKLVCFYYRQATTTNTSNVGRVIFDEDYVANINNIYDGCESFGALWTNGANATISNTQVLSGSHSIKIDNSVSTGGINDYVIWQAWTTNSALATNNIAISFWRYQESNDSNNAFRILDSSDSYNTNSPRVQIAVLGNASNHLEWYNGSAYQDTGGIVSNGSWHKITVFVNADSSSVIGRILVDNVQVSNSLGQYSSGSAPYSVEWLGASLVSAHNVIDYLDQVYTHQYIATAPTVTVGSQRTKTPAFVLFQSRVA